MKLFTLVLSFNALLSSFAVADTFDRQECLTNVDANHSCACNDIRTDDAADPAAFDLNRADIQTVYRTLQTSEFYTSVQDQKLVAALKAGYQDRREQLGCHDRVAMKMGELALSQDFCIHEKAAAEALGQPWCRTVDAAAQAKATEIVKARATQYFGSLELVGQHLTFCSVDQTVKKPNMVTIARVTPPCKIDLKSLFPNNVSQLTVDQVKKITDYIQNHACYKQYLADTSSLKKIEISSSSSLLANTGLAAKKTFLQLSQERADEIEKKIVANVFSKEVFTQAEYVKNATGSNGDGSTGACPYAYHQKKKTWSRRAFPTDVQLEANKKTELNFYFGEQTETFENLDPSTRTHATMMAVPCKQVRFYCQ